MNTNFFIVVTQLRTIFRNRVTVEANDKIFCVVPSGDHNLAQFIASALNEKVLRDSAIPAMEKLK